MSTHKTPTAASEPALTVIDTNVVLDWLVFGDASMAGLRPALQTGRLRWIACARMLEEHRRLFSGSLAAGRGADRATLETAWQQFAHVLPQPATDHRLVCRDPDDQVFIDLAVQHRAAWLLTRDRALLKLAKRAVAHGVHVLTPLQWLARMQPTPEA